ncbi:MAG: ATP-binding cassette domain-containing protein, partial [Lachnospira sp.]|nr:ATP-binding cassette domain-containing protein [Lachnospira sp.]
MFVKTTVVNTQIALENIEMEFNNRGIYIISGENGCGKSSVLKKIVFEENNIQFNNEDTQCLFNEDRGLVMGYAEQDPLAYDCSLYKYLTRYGDNVDRGKLKTYLEQFDLGYLRLNQNITGLSGGELIKANIIASLLRETPYIFMDEPTNNLDNEGVRRFVDIVTEYAKEHTVVIVSHDPRMQFDEVTEYVIKDSRILKKASMKNVAENKGKKSRCRLSLKKVISDYIVSPGGVASMFFMALVMCLIVFGNYIIYYSTMATEKNIHQKDVIVGYKVDEQYDELNKIYTGSENIDVDEDKYYQMLYFKDLEKLIEDERIKGILLPDVEYIDKLNQKNVEYRSGKSAIDQVLLFSLPEYILKNFGGQITLPQNVLMLKEGRLPQDNCKEVVISE